MSLLQTRTDVLTRGALDGLAARQRVFANNIANIETPGFQPGDVPFEAQLRQLREELADDGGAGGSAPRLALEEVPAPMVGDRADGNGVQADRQAMRVIENTMTYEALAAAARLREGILRTVLTEGGKQG